MSSLLRPESYSLEEYFALERVSERRFEYRDGEIVCMSGGSVEHAAIARNIVAYLATKLRGGSCNVYGSDLAVYVPAAQPYRYPDVSVVCGEMKLHSVDRRDCLENPVLLIEVLSPSSADYDRGTKFEEYKSIPTFVEYLLVSQDRIQVTHRVRQAHNSWHETVLDSMDSAIYLEATGVSLHLQEIYDGLSFPSAE